MPFIENQNRIIQPIPFPGLGIDALRSDGVFQAGEASKKYHVRVDVHSSVLVKNGQPENVGQILSKWDFSRIDIAALDLSQPLLRRGFLEKVAEIWRRRHDTKSSISKRP